MPEAFRAFRGPNGRPEANVFDTDFLKKKAEFAKAIALQSARGGNDLDATEICDFADELYEEFSKREWVLQIPTPEELKKQLDERDSVTTSE
jgi:hypothetical protein